MSDTRRFFHDRFVLFVLTTNAFLTLLCITTVLLRIGGSGDRYIQSFRSNLGLGAITVGGVEEMISFAVFAGILFAVHIYIALQFYKIRKTVSWVTMVLTTLLLILCLIVSNALLELQ